VDVDQPLVIAQSNDGNVHIISWSWSRGVSYSRIELVRSNGHVSGFYAAESNVGFSANLNFADLSADLVAGSDSIGNPTLLYSFYDNGSNGGRVLAGKTTVAAGIAPMTSSDFVALDNSPGATQLDNIPNNSWAAPHNAGVLMAQHPVSKDVWFQWGPINT
jgi:hypothetical protein